MENIMVCVTKQKNCQRLIDYGKKLMTGEDDVLHIVHVSDSEYNFLGDTEEGRALEFLYEKSREAGANLTVLKSDNVLNTLVNTIEENNIDRVVVGATKAEPCFDGFLINFEKAIKGRAKMEVVPPNQCI